MAGLLNSFFSKFHSGRQPKSPPPEPRLVAVVEAVHGKLNVRVYSHYYRCSRNCRLHRAPIPCWTYMSEGLAAIGQKEIAFTLRRLETEKENDFPMMFVKVAHNVYDAVTEGQLAEYKAVDKGMLLRFSSADFPNISMSAVIIIKGHPLEGVDTPSEFLHAILITDEEYKVSLNHGRLRVLGNMSVTHRLFPCPPWSDRSRASYISMNDLQTSILNNTSGFNFPDASATQVAKRGKNFDIVLKVNPDSRAHMIRAISEKKAALAIFTGLAPGVDSVWVFKDGQKQPTRMGSSTNPSRTAGNFITFLPRSSMAFFQVEDGYAIMMTDSERQRLERAIAAGESFSTKLDSHTHFRLEWDDHASHRNREEHLDIVKIGEVVLQTSTSVFGERLSAHELADYIARLYSAVQKHFMSMETKGPTMTLSMFVTVNEDGSAVIELTKDPQQYPDAILLINRLQRDLEAVDRPYVRNGPISFGITYTIWSGHQ